MQETLISFDTAKLAKEKGFNYNGYWRWSPDAGHNECCSQFLLAKWLRDVHGIHLQIAFSIVERMYNVHFFNEDYSKETDVFYGPYEEALEEGLKEALKLI
jgi:hypothetical protein